MNNYIIKAMHKTELDFAIELATLEGWNPGLHDRDCFYAADNSGFFIGLLNGEPIACLSAVKYSDSFGFIGLYIVKQAYRNRGYGMQIWHTGLAYLKNCNIGLDGVIAQQHNYKKSGFQFAHRNMRYQGLTGGKLVHDLRLIKLTDVAFSEINCYDRAFFPTTRSAFLQAWINQPESIALGILEKNQLVAYGVIRSCHRGYKIAPLFANTLELADILFSALKASVTIGQPVFLDIPEHNPDALALVERHQMSMVFETARMYNQKFPDLAFPRLYGITSFELG